MHSCTCTCELCTISGLCHEINEKCPLLGYYVVSSGNFLPTFRYNLSVPSARDFYPLILIFFLYYSIHYDVLYWFLLVCLCSCLLITFLFPFVPVLFSTVGSWCLPALHVVFLPWSSTGLWLSPLLLFCFGLSIY